MTVDDTRSGLQQALDALTGAAQSQEAPAVIAAPSASAKGIGSIEGIGTIGGIESVDIEPVSEAPTVRLSGPVDETWLELWYQPKIDLRQKCLAGAEALARLRHPEHGVLSPDSYVSSADEDSLARLFERAILTTLSDWSAFGDAGFNLRLAINVPVQLLFKSPLPKLVRENCPKSELWPGLIVEVTEDQFVRDAKCAREIAAELRANGVAIAIDDFGAGYSSFATMRELAFAELKIAKTFVASCAADATKSAICQTAVDLAHRFGSTAVAGGIDNVADLQALQILECDFGQGTLLAPPMTKERFIELLQRRLNKGPAPQASLAEPSATRLSA